MKPCPASRSALALLSRATQASQSSKSTAINTTRALTTTTNTLADGKEKGGFFGNFFDRKIETQESSHSAKFASAKEEIIELQTHNVKPDSLEK